MPDALNRELAGFVELYRDGRVLEIRMVKPKVNAICPRLSWALERAALYLQDSPELQVGLLTSGCDKAFSAGLDFNDATGERSAGDDRRPVEGGFGGITLAHNAASREQVDAILRLAVQAGGRLLKEAVAADWGGYSGYFADPDGHPWEVAWNPYFPLADDGSLQLP